MAEELAVSSIRRAILARILPGVMRRYGCDHSSLSDSIRAWLALLQNAHRDLFTVSGEGQIARIKVKTCNTLM